MLVVPFKAWWKTHCCVLRKAACCNRPGTLTATFYSMFLLDLIKFSSFISLSSEYKRFCSIVGLLPHKLTDA